MHARSILLLTSSFILGVGAIAIGACNSGSIASSPDASADASVDGNNTIDGGSLDSSLPTQCPATLPNAGDPCNSVGGNCEYGGDGELRLCSTTAACSAPAGSGQGTWIVEPPDAGCVGTQAQNPAACPPTFASVATGSACPPGTATSGACVYPEGMCGCVSCNQNEDGGSITQATEWECDSYTTPNTGCPTPRPALGSACTQAGLSCTYGSGCGSPEPLEGYSCQNDIWVAALVAIECPIQVCGNK